GFYRDEDALAAYEPVGKNMFFSTRYLQHGTNRLSSNLDRGDLSVLLHEFDHAEKDLERDPLGYDGTGNTEPITGISFSKGMVAVGSAIAAWNLAQVGRDAVRDRNTPTERARGASQQIFQQFLKQQRDGKLESKLGDPRLCADEVTGQHMQQASFRLLLTMQ